MGDVAQWFERAGGVGKAAEIYGFTTVAELQFFRWFLGSEFTGRGAAVELGCALGRSTVAMLDGLAANPRARHSRLHVYDLFQFDWWLLEQYRKLPGVDASGFEMGSSFTRIFEANLGSRAERAVVHSGDIEEEHWNGGPIEFLFVDIMKNWAATRAVIENFFPHLEPGLSTVVHQDFKIPFQIQVPLTMYRLRDWFEPVWTICGSGISASVVFRCVRKPETGELRRALDAGLCDIRSYSIGEIEAALEHALAIVERDPPLEVSLLRAARFVALTELAIERPSEVREAAEIDLVCRFVRHHLEPFRERDDAQRWSTEAEAAKSREEDRLRLIEELASAHGELARIKGSRAWAWIERFWRLRRRLAS